VDARYDVIIVGGGAAGLSAALMLGRCRRGVLVIDSGRYRNERAVHVHGYLTRDCTPPDEIRRIARTELDRYGVQIQCDTVTHVRRDGNAFTAELESGGVCAARKIVLATGMVDRVPPIEGIDRFYGSSVHHCPYCDAWEHNDQPMAVYGRGKRGLGLAMSLRTWTPHVVLCTDGPSGLSAADRTRLAELRVPLRTVKIARLEGEDRDLQRIVLADGEALECRAVFFSTGQQQSCGLAAELGLRMTGRGAIQTDRWERTSIPGIYAAGDCSRNVQWVVVAAAQGAIAAQAINRELEGASGKGGSRS